jgi:hypothetical protein
VDLHWQVCSQGHPQLLQLPWVGLVVRPPHPPLDITQGLVAAQCLQQQQQQQQQAAEAWATALPHQGPAQLLVALRVLQAAAGPPQHKPLALLLLLQPPPAAHLRWRARGGRWVTCSSSWPK